MKNITITYRNFLWNFKSYFDSVNGSMGIESKDLSVMLLVLLYHNKKITRKQLSIYLNRYSEKSTYTDWTGTTYNQDFLSRTIRTYHSKVNDQWYNDYNFTAILMDLIDDCESFEIPIDQFLTYLNYGFSMNRNWCVNYFGLSIVKPMISHGHDAFDVLQDWGFDIEHISYEEADRKYDLSSGYCCRDCDGCLGEYKRSRYEYYYKKSDDKIKKPVFSQLMNLKKHTKNPSDALIEKF